MSKFTEEKLEQAIIALLEEQGYPYHRGDTLTRKPTEVLLREDLRAFLATRYAADGITEGEMESIIRQIDGHSAADLYESNRAIHKLVADGLLLKREDRSQKDLYIQLIDYAGLPLQRLLSDAGVETAVTERSAQYGAEANVYRIVNQLEIEGYEKRIPDGILYINGLPLVVFEFKSAIREEATFTTPMCS
jgi:type I restriction enzyme R subunit